MSRSASPNLRIQASSRAGLPTTTASSVPHRTIWSATAYPDRLRILAGIIACSQPIRTTGGWKGPFVLRVHGNLQTNSSEVVRECLISGLGIALRSTWDVGEQLQSGDLKIVLPQYRASRRVGVYAVYPSRRFLPVKVRAFIDFLADLYGPEPYWDRGLDLEDLTQESVAVA